MFGYLGLNEKYVRVMNEYYRKMAPSGKENKNTGNTLLFELEKDHRNLVKLCLNMEDEIKYPHYYPEITYPKWENSTR